MNEETERLRFIDDVPYVSVGIAAEKLGVSVATVRRWCGEGVLKYVQRPSGHRLVTLDSINNLNRDLLGTLNEAELLAGAVKRRAASGEPLRLHPPVGPFGDQTLRVLGVDPDGRRTDFACVETSSDLWLVVAAGRIDVRSQKSMLAATQKLMAVLLQTTSEAVVLPEIPVTDQGMVARMMTPVLRAAQESHCPVFTYSASDVDSTLVSLRAQQRAEPLLENGELLAPILLACCHLQRVKDQRSRWKPRIPLLPRLGRPRAGEGK
jgi:hypothetical protein